MSNMTNDVYAFFGDGRKSPKSDLISLSIYSEGQAVISDETSTFQVKLRKVTR